MPFSLKKSLRGIDAFGHKIAVNYKGEESYKSQLGGVLTILVYTLTLILVVKSGEEIVKMADPTLKEYSQPLTNSVRQELVPLNFADYGFVIGISFEIEEISTKQIVSNSLPEELVTPVQWISNDSDQGMESMIDCKEVIEESVMATADPKFFQNYKQGQTKCLDPKLTYESLFVDSQQNGSKFSQILFRYCQGQTASGKSCVDPESWKKNFMLRFEFFAVTTSIDFMAREDYFSQSVISFHKQIGLETGFLTSALNLNKIEMQDALFNPFQTTTDSREFLTVDQSLFVEMSSEVPFFLLQFKINSSSKMMSRQRYNLWQALADIGGFHDGMRLLVTIFMAPLSSSFFFQSFSSGGHYSPKKSSKLQKDRQTAALLLENQQGGQEWQSWALSLIAEQTKHLVKIKTSLYQAFNDWICRNKDRRRRAQQSLNDQMSSHLDIRRIISNSIAQRDFIRTFLTPQQHRLLAHQRTRMATFKSDTSASDSNKDDFEKFDPAGLFSDIAHFQPENDFERRLLLGTLYRKGKMKHETPLLNYQQTSQLSSSQLQNMSGLSLGKEQNFVSMVSRNSHSHLNPTQKQQVQGYTARNIVLQAQTDHA